MAESIQCVILADGRGTRLGYLGIDRPKHLVWIQGRPSADFQLDWLAPSGVGEVVYCIGHRGNQIADHVRSGEEFDLAIS